MNAPYGEEKSDKNVSDDARNPSASIYSVAAMRERKVQVNKVTILEGSGKILLGDAWQRDYLQGIGGNAEDIFKLATAASEGSRRSGLLAYSGGAVRTKGIKATGKKRVEIVLVDVYTNQIIKKRTALQVLTASNMAIKTKQKGYNYGFDLNFGSDYVIKGNAAGYSQAELSISDFYTEGVEVIRDTLFLAPFAGVPTTLYFANDNPDPNTKRSKTGVSYEKSYRSFLPKIELRQAIQSLVSLCGCCSGSNKRNGRIF
ncbi:MAG: hypothetical protein HC817_04785 [Saprospiraceae bacterium]|nr:hypothetical protein [Saprospiraceae bacterium]